MNFIFDWVFNVALKKALAKGIKAGIGALAAFLPVLAQYGINVQVDQAVLAAAAVTAIVGGYEFVRNWLKSRGINLP